LRGIFCFLVVAGGAFTSCYLLHPNVRRRVQAIHNPEDFITSCEASWRPELLVDSHTSIDVERAILAESHAGVFLRRCRLAFVSMPFEVRPLQ
jgi:hypothetical protein